MAMKEKQLVTSRCRLCRRKHDTEADFKNIKVTRLPTSKKTIKDVLTHLAKCIKGDVILQDISCVCGPCYEKLSEYDQIMLQLLTHQKELSRLLETSINTLDFCDEKDADQKTDLDDTDDSDDSSQEPGEDTSGIPTAFYYECSLCDQKLKSKNSLNRHLEAHAKAKRCHICGVLRKDEEYLELHMNVHEGKTENDCRFCPKQYSRRSHVIRHMHLHWDKKKYQCEKCGLRFSQAQQFYNHKMHHEAEENPLVCLKCDQTFKSSKTYKHHLVTHRDDRPMYPCEMCGKQFSEKYTLKIHLKTHLDHVEENTKARKKRRTEKEFPCIICNTVLGSREVLEAHMTAQHDVVTPLL